MRFMPVIFIALLIFTVGDFSVRNWSDIERSVNTRAGYAEVQHEFDVARAKDIIAKEDARIAARSTKRIAARHAE